MEREITLREYGRVLWSGRWVLLACAVAAAVVGLALSLASTTTYTATAEVSLGQATTVSGTPISTPATNPATAATVLGSDRIVAAVAEELDITPGAVRRAIDISAPRTSGGAAGNQPTLIVLEWKGDDRGLAERGVNAYAREVERFMLEQNGDVTGTLETMIADSQADVTRLTAETATYRRQLAGASGDARITLQGLLSSATTQLAAAQTLLSDNRLALSKANQIEQPSILSLAESATSSAGVTNRARTVVIAIVIGLILGTIITFIWRGSPAGRAGRQD